jgi:replication-associated recombination protein RarA
MNMQLTEQYRPQTWDDVVGQDDVLATINTLRKRGLGGRAYVLTGKSGTGKTTIARLIAADVAGPLAVQEENAKDVTIRYIQDMEEDMQTRVLPSDDSGKTGRAWIFNEIHAFSDAVVTRLLTTLEKLPAHVVIVFTTTAKAQKSLFAEFEDAQPFLQRCKRLALSQQALSKPFAERLQAICRAEGLGNPTLEQCVKLVNEENASLRGAIDRAEDGCFLGGATLAVA